MILNLNRQKLEVFIVYSLFEPEWYRLTKILPADEKLIWYDFSNQKSGTVGSPEYSQWLFREI
jgi:hypothetical protein